MNCNLCGEAHETAKCPELKNMLEMVGDLVKRQYPHVATVVAAAKARIEAMEAVVEKLPLTKDGVRVVPGVDNVWRITWRGDIEQCEIEIRQPYAECEYYFVDPTEVPNCYSTREAAEAAIAKAKGNE